MNILKPEQIREVRRELGLSQTELAKKLDVSLRAVQTWEGGTRSPKFEIMQKITNLYENYEQKGIRKQYIKSNAVKLSDDIPTMLVPLIHQYAYAGYLSGFSDPEYIDELPKIPFIVENGTHKGNYLAFEVRGDSMDNNTKEAYQSGDYVLAREIQQQHWINKLHIKKWDFVIIHRTEGVLIKRISDHNINTGYITLHSLNEEYEDTSVNLDDIVQLFNVVKVLRNK